MGTSQTIREIQTAVSDIDTGINELNTVKNLVAMEASRSDSEFDSGQDFSSIINSANTAVDGAIDELKKARASLQGVMSALK
jgi:hypothetical protein